MYQTAISSCVVLKQYFVDQVFLTDGAKLLLLGIALCLILVTQKCSCTHYSHSYIPAFSCTGGKKLDSEEENLGLAGTLKTTIPGVYFRQYLPVSNKVRDL